VIENCEGINKPLTWVSVISRKHFLKPLQIY